MKFCKLITEVDLELLEELVDNGYPVDRIEENGQVYYKTPAMLCQNLKANDEVRNYSNGLISMSIENVRKKKGLYRTGNLLIDMDSNIIQKGKEKIFIPKASFTIISTLMDVPHKTVSRSALVFYLEQAYHHEILDNTLTVISLQFVAFWVMNTSKPIKLLAIFGISMFLKWDKVEKWLERKV